MMVNILVKNLAKHVVNMFSQVSTCGQHELLFGTSVGDGTKHDGQHTGQKPG